MPRHAPYLLRWSPQTQAYELLSTDRVILSNLAVDNPAWFAWLTDISSFAFISQTGAHCTVQKETIRPDGIYWYAYRSQQRRTIKRYLGRTSDLSIARLEETADNLRNPSPLPVAASEQTHGGPPHSLLSTSSLPPLLATQLHPPRLPATVIERPQLFAQLDSWHATKLTLLSAPAGFGKTTLLTSWLATRSIDAAWVSLEANDNDPLHFWRVILTACQRWPSSAARDALRWLLTSTQPLLPHSSLTEVIRSFCHAITKQGITGLLILDNYQIITESRVHETLSFFLSHLPEMLHLILLTRADPPLPLARLRANGELHDIQTRDLRFSHDETASFFQQAAACSLSSEVLAALDTHLEGWAAGLRLLSLSLRGSMTQQEMGHVLMTFRGNHRSVREYFVTEVLETQPEPLQDFLLRTSVLPRLQASLCAAITERSERTVLLADLERANLFLEPLDASNEWYRYQPIFAEAMQREAHLRLGEDTLRTVLQDACAWYQQHGLLSEAIDTALQAEAFEQAALLIEDIVHHTYLFAFQEYHTLRRWLARIPEPLLRQHPRLCFSAALALAFNQDSSEINQTRFTRIEELLHVAEEKWRAHNNLAALGELSAFRAVLSYQQGAGNQASIWATQALTWLPATEQQWHALSLRVLAIEELRAGQFRQAFQLFQAIEQHHQAPDPPSTLDGTPLFLGMICFELGALQQAHEYFCQMTTHSVKDSPVALLAHLGQAYVSYEQNSLEQAAQQLQVIQKVVDQGAASEETPRSFQRLFHALLQLLQARLQYAQGQTSQAIQLLTTLLPQIRLYPGEFHQYFTQEALSSLIQFSQTLENPISVQYWFDNLSLTDSQQAPETQLLSLPTNPSAVAVQSERQNPLPLQKEDTPVLQQQRVLLLVRLSLAQGDASSALTTLNALLSSAQAAGRRRQILQIFLLMSQAYALHHQTTEAHQSLLKGLQQGYFEGYQRTILDEGKTLFPLLQDLLLSLHDQPLRAYIQTLHQALAQTHKTHSSTVPALLEPLSSQEQRVLRKLTVGLSNAEIAQELTVSINTVRSQVQSIYHKLQVHNRHAAAEVARTLHLL